MSQSDHNSTASNSSRPDSEVYELIIDLCKDEMQIMLDNMIKTASSFAEWTLSDSDKTRLVDQLSEKHRMIKSSFSFQLEKGFSDFQSTGKSLSRHKATGNSKILELVGVNSSNDVEELEATLQGLEKAYSNFYQTLIQRLKYCLSRTKSKAKIEIDENPMHLKFLCEAFQNSIDSLKLEAKYNLALHRLFTDTTLAKLGPIYRKMESCMLDHNILPQLKPARFSLRNCANLSESMPPKSMPFSEDLKLIMLLQIFKEKSRDTTKKYQNLFPDLKQELLNEGYSNFDQPLEQLNSQFAMIFNDEDLPANIKAQIARLQVYIFISAIHEEGFLNRSSHPARRLIDTVVMSEVEFATSGNSQQSRHNMLKEGIDKLIDSQLVNSESYQALLTLYKSSPDTTARKDNKNQQESEPTDPTKISGIVDAILEGIVGPLKAQKKSLQIFEEVWSPLMLEVALTHGFNSSAWHKVVAVVKTHVWALIPKSTEKEKSKLLAAFPRVAMSLKGVMKNLKFTAREQDLLLENLNSEHDDVLEKTSFNIGQATQELKIISAKNRIMESLHESNKVEEPEQKELISDIDDFFSMIGKNKKTGSKPMPKATNSKPSTEKPSPKSSTREPSLPATDSAIKTSQKGNASAAEKMQVGDWIECKQGSKTIMAKLTWKADDSSLFIFVDRDGKRVSEVDGNTLISELKSGQKSLVDLQSQSSKRKQSSFLRTLGS